MRSTCPRVPGSEFDSPRTLNVFPLKPAHCCNQDHRYGAEPIVRTA